MELSQHTVESWMENEETLMNNLQNSSWKTFPLLNYVDLGLLKDGQLVRFVGMVQDMRNPEYYIESYIITDKETNQRTIKHTKYKEFIEYKNEMGDIHDYEVVQKERQTFYVISVPAENEWARTMKAEQYKTPTEHSSQGNTVQKRSLEDKSAMDTDEKLENVQPSSEQKRHCVNTSRSNENVLPKKNTSTEHLLNFPIEDKNGKACLVKVYGNQDQIKLNNIYEFVGFLSIDPQLSHECIPDSEKSIEDELHNPPPSLIPRLHCLSFKIVKNGNPLVEDFTIDSQQFEDTRKNIMILFSQLLLGDEIAAEYLLFHLISEVYTRADNMALGKFSLNLSNIPVLNNLNYVEELYKFIQLFVPKSHYLPLTLENLNTVTFIPKKDYDSDRLNSGMLQLSANTILVVDETKLQPGKLDQPGLEAVKAISNLIKNQRLSYDFSYYPVEFDCDVPCLIASEGKSMLPSDFHVVLRPDNAHVETFNEIIQAANFFLKPELLDNIRNYLTLCRFAPYTIDDNVHTMIQNQFIKMRQHGATGDDLHNLLVLSRLVCLSRGKGVLDSESWEIAYTLEDQRKQRLPK